MIASKKTGKTANCLRRAYEVVTTPSQFFYRLPARPPDRTACTRSPSRGPIAAIQGEGSQHWQAQDEPQAVLLPLDSEGQHTRVSIAGYYKLKESGWGRGSTALSPCTGGYR